MTKCENSELIWHYTSLEGLLGIVQSHRVWATAAAYLNDKDEFITGARAYLATLERLRGELAGDEREVLDEISGRSVDPVHDVFVLSASLEDDLLTLWRSYGDSGGGFAIGLDPSVTLGPVAQSSEKKHPKPSTKYSQSGSEVGDDGEPRFLYNPDAHSGQGGSWRKVEYVPVTGNDSHRDNILSEVQKRLEARSKGTSPWFIDFSWPETSYSREKELAFEDEREFRAVVYATPDWQFVKYRSGKFGLTPYVELGAGVNDEGFVEFVRDPRKIERLPIRAVNIGPGGHNSDETKHALSRLLEDNGYGEACIGRSEIPYR